MNTFVEVVLMNTSYFTRSRIFIYVIDRGSTICRFRNLLLHDVYLCYSNIKQLVSWEIVHTNNIDSLSMDCTKKYPRVLELADANRSKNKLSEYQWSWLEKLEYHIRKKLLLDNYLSRNV